MNISFSRMSQIASGLNWSPEIAQKNLEIVLATNASRSCDLHEIMDILIPLGLDAKTAMRFQLKVENVIKGERKAYDCID